MISPIPSSLKQSKFRIFSMIRGITTISGKKNNMERTTVLQKIPMEDTTEPKTGVKQWLDIQ